MTDDARLLLAYAREGDVKSFSALVVRHSQWLAGFLRGLVPTAADAEDAVQETWVRVIRACGSYRGGSVRAYLARAARSVVVDRFRRGRHLVASIDAMGEEGAALSEAVVDGAPPPDAAFKSRATAEDVRRAVRALPEGQREVLLMRIEAELPFSEIAEELGIPLGTALTWMHAATLRLKRELGRWK